MVLVIFEGAIRKWLLPGAQDLVYFGKDVLLIGAFGGFVASGVAARSRGLVPPALTGFLMAGLAYGHPWRWSIHCSRRPCSESWASRPTSSMRRFSGSCRQSSPPIRSWADSSSGFFYSRCQWACWRPPSSSASPAGSWLNTYARGQAASWRWASAAQHSCGSPVPSPSSVVSVPTSWQPPRCCWAFSALTGWHYLATLGSHLPGLLSHQHDDDRIQGPGLHPHTHTSSLLVAVVGAREAGCRNVRSVCARSVDVRRGLAPCPSGGRRVLWPSLQRIRNRRRGKVSPSRSIAPLHAAASAGILLGLASARPTKRQGRSSPGAIHVLAPRQPDRTRDRARHARAGSNRLHLVRLAPGPSCVRVRCEHSPALALPPLHECSPLRRHSSYSADPLGSVVYDPTASLYHWFIAALVPTMVALDRRSGSQGSRGRCRSWEPRPRLQHASSDSPDFLGQPMDGPGPRTPAASTRIERRLALEDAGLLTAYWSGVPSSREHFESASGWLRSRLRSYQSVRLPAAKTAGSPLTQPVAVSAIRSCPRNSPPGTTSRRAGASTGEFGAGFRP